MERLSLMSGFMVRAALGVGMGLFFSAMAIFVARMIYVAFGLTSWDAWFAMFIVGGGVGAAAGNLVNLLGTGPPGRLMALVIFFLLTAAAGAGLSWGMARKSNGVLGPRWAHWPTQFSAPRWRAAPWGCFWVVWGGLPSKDPCRTERLNTAK